MSEELGAVLEAPEVTDEVIEQDIDVTPEVDGAAEVTPEAKEETPGDWRNVPAELKDFFKSPAGKKAKDAWFERKAWNEKFEGGSKQADEILSFLNEQGGKEGLATALGELKGKAEELDGISVKMANGDPSLIADLVQNSPDGFAKLAPVVAEQWARVDPEGWGAAMSGVMAATIQSNGVPMFLEKMGMLLEFGKTEDVAKMVQDLKGWANGFAEKAAAPRTQQPAQDARSAFEKERQEFYANKAKDEKDSFTSKIREEADTAFRTPTITKELESFFKRRPKDADAKELAISTVKSQVLERMKNDQKYQDSLTLFTSRGDKEGALKLLKSRETAAITEIAPKVGRMIFGNPGPVAVDKPGAAAGTKPEAGFTPVATPPKPETIDRFRTTDAMIMRGQFILKDGRKMTLEG